MTPAVVRLVPFVLSWPLAFPLDISDEFEREEVVYSGGNGTFADQGFSDFFLLAKRVLESVHAHVWLRLTGLGRDSAATPSRRQSSLPLPREC